MLPHREATRAFFFILIATRANGRVTSRRRAKADAYEPEEPRGRTFDEPIGESIWLTDPNGGITISIASEIEVIEPNESECKHEFTIDCAVGGCNDCLKCMDCGEDLFPKGRE